MGAQKRARIYPLRTDRSADFVVEDDADTREGTDRTTPVLYDKGTAKARARRRCVTRVEIAERYCKVPEYVLYHQRMTCREKRFLLVLMHSRNPVTGTCTPVRAKLAQRLGKSPRTISSYISRLTERGYIERVMDGITPVYAIHEDYIECMVGTDASPRYVEGWEYLLYHPHLSDAEIILLLILLRHRNHDTGACNPRQKRLAKLVRLSESTVSSLLSGLITREFVSRDTQHGLTFYHVHEEAIEVDANAVTDAHTDWSDVEGCQIWQGQPLQKSDVRVEEIRRQPLQKSDVRVEEIRGAHYIYNETLEQEYLNDINERNATLHSKDIFFGGEEKRDPTPEYGHEVPAPIPSEQWSGQTGSVLPTQSHVVPPPSQPKKKGGAAELRGFDALDSDYWIQRRLADRLIRKGVAAPALRGILEAWIIAHADYRMSSPCIADIKGLHTLAGYHTEGRLITAISVMADHMYRKMSRLRGILDGTDPVSGQLEQVMRQREDRLKSARADRLSYLELEYHERQEFWRRLRREVEDGVLDEVLRRYCDEQQEQGVRAFLDEQGIKQEPF